MTEGITPIALDPTRWGMHPPPLAEGVVGFTSMVGNDLWIGFIAGDPPGEGHVGAYLDSCCLGVKAFEASPGRVIVLETMNMVLEGMLKRRGFKQTEMNLPHRDERVSVHIYG